MFSAPMMAYVVPDVAPTHLHDGAGSGRAAVQRKAPVGTLRCAARTNKTGSAASTLVDGTAWKGRLSAHQNDAKLSTKPAPPLRTSTGGE